MCRRASDLLPADPSFGPITPGALKPRYGVSIHQSLLLGRSRMHFVSQSNVYLGRRQAAVGSVRYGEE